MVRVIFKGSECFSLIMYNISKNQQSVIDFRVQIISPNELLQLKARLQNIRLGMGILHLKLYALVRGIHMTAFPTTGF